MSKIKVFVEDVAVAGHNYIEVDESGLPRNPVQIREKVDEYLKNGGEFYNVSSDIPLNYIGILIEMGKFNKEDITINLMGREDIFFDNGGFLCNWPIGFFYREKGDTFYLEKDK